MALLLSAIGLYGVLYHSVVLQQRQIGIRMALGARAAQVVRHVTGALLAAVAAVPRSGWAAGSSSAACWRACCSASRPPT